MTGMHCQDPFPDGSPAVFLLHGLGANSGMWALQFQALQSIGLRPLAPDIPGFGDSKYDGRGWNFRRVAADLAGMVTDLQIGPVHVIGLSMGGVIAQQLALDYPMLVRKLVLVSTFSVLQPSSLSQWFYFAQRAAVVHLVGLQAQSKIVAMRVFPGPEQAELRRMAEEQIASADPRAYRAAMRSLAFFNSRRRLHEIKVPTLVISGADDNTVAPVQQKALADEIHGARHVVIPKAGHAVAIDQYELFNSLVLDFLGN